MKKYEPFCVSQNEFEQQLMKHENLVQPEDNIFPDPPAACGLCGDPFENKRFLVDGMLDEANNPWAFLCAKCFFAHGLGIGWGKGQLFTHVKDGRWLQTAGSRDVK